jgi:hypothetical protein
LRDLVPLDHKRTTGDQGVVAAVGEAVPPSTTWRYPHRSDPTTSWQLLGLQRTKGAHHWKEGAAVEEVRQWAGIRGRSRMAAVAEGGMGHLTLGRVHRMVVGLEEVHRMVVGLEEVHRMAVGLEEARPSSPTRRDHQRHSRVPRDLRMHFGEDAAIDCVLAEVALRVLVSVSSFPFEPLVHTPDILAYLEDFGSPACCIRPWELDGMGLPVAEDHR